MERPKWQKTGILDEIDEYAEVLFPSGAVHDFNDAPNAETAPEDFNSASESSEKRVKTKAHPLKYENGLPKVPNPDSLKHREMARLLREFMTFHYRGELFGNTD